MGSASETPPRGRPNQIVSERISKVIGLHNNHVYGVRTEWIGFGLWWRSCSILYLELTGRAVLIRKTKVEETQFQFTFRSRILSLQSARSSWPNCSSATKFLISRDRVLSPSRDRLSPTLSCQHYKRKKTWRNLDANSRLHSTVKSAIEGHKYTQYTSQIVYVLNRLLERSIMSMGRACLLDNLPSIWGGTICSINCWVYPI